MLRFVFQRCNCCFKALLQFKWRRPQWTKCMEVFFYCFQYIINQRILYMSIYLSITWTAVYYYSFFSILKYRKPIVEIDFTVYLNIIERAKKTQIDCKMKINVERRDFPDCDRIIFFTESAFSRPNIFRFVRCNILLVIYIWLI